MTWIREAEHAGRTQAELKAARKLAFEQEEVSEERVAAHLNTHEAVVLPLIKDLKKAGYKVTKNGPGYLHHSYRGEPGSSEDLSKFALTRVVESTGWGMTDYSKWENQVFGLEWIITKKGLSQYDNLLGTVAIYPTVDDNTHYADVQYRATSYIEWPPKLHIVKSPDISTGLKQTIQGWIIKAQAPTAKK